MPENCLHACPEQLGTVATRAAQPTNRPAGLPDVKYSSPPHASIMHFDA